MTRQQAEERLPEKQGLKPLNDAFNTYYQMAEERLPEKQGLKPSLHRWLLARSIMLRKDFQKNKDWNSLETSLRPWSGWRLRKDFQKNKDWNTISWSSFMCFTTKLRKDFQKNKDWNQETLQHINSWSRAEERLPEKQGLKLTIGLSLVGVPLLLRKDFQKNKDWNTAYFFWFSVEPCAEERLPEKQGLKLSLHAAPSSELWRLRKDFQKNKDWNLSACLTPWMDTVCWGKTSRKTRIETRNVVVANCTSTNAEERLPEKQGLKLV